MSTAGKVLAYAAFSAMAAYGLLGAIFVAGEAFDDPGGWAAAGLVALWLLPLVGLAVLALRAPAVAAPVLVALSVAAVLFALADGAFGIIPRDDWGPVTSIGVWALGVALAFLGLRRPSLAGVLLLVVGLGRLTGALLEGARGSGPRGPGAGATMGGSTGAVVMPLLIVGVLFLAAGLVDRNGDTPASRVD